MKMKQAPIFWILAVALASQGALPGVVLCFETAGGVRVETLSDKCCDEGERSAQPTKLAPQLQSPESTAGRPCGTCTDRPISPIPGTHPARSGAVRVALPCMALAADLAKMQTTGGCDLPRIASYASLVPLMTTSLRI